MLMAWTRGRHRVIPTPAPGVTATDPPYCKPTAGESAMPFNRHQRIFGAAGCKPALTQRSDQEGFGRRNHQPIYPHYQQ